MSDKPYGFDVTYRTTDGRELTCHYVGSERTARRKAMLRSCATEVIAVTPISEREWTRLYGRRERM